MNCVACNDCRFLKSSSLDIGGPVPHHITVYSCIHSSCFEDACDPLNGAAKERITDYEKKNKHGRCEDFLPRRQNRPTKKQIKQIARARRRRR